MGSPPTTGQAQLIGTAIIVGLGAVVVSSLGVWLFATTPLGRFGTVTLRVDRRKSLV